MSFVYFVFSRGDRYGQIYFQRNEDNSMASQPFLTATVQEAGSPLPTKVEAVPLGPELGTGPLGPAGCSQGKTTVADNVASLWFQEPKEMSVASGTEHDLL